MAKGRRRKVAATAVIWLRLSLLMCLVAAIFSLVVPVALRNGSYVERVAVSLQRDAERATGDGAILDDGAVLGFHLRFSGWRLWPSMSVVIAAAAAGSAGLALWLGADRFVAGMSGLIALALGLGVLLS